MFSLSNATNIYGRLTVVIATVFIYWQNLALIGIYVDAEIHITSSNGDEQYEISDCRVQENTSGISVIVNGGSCQLKVRTSPTSVLVVEINDEHVNGTDIIYVESQEADSKCAPYVTIDGDLKHCRAAFLQSTILLHLRGSLVLQLQEVVQENLDSNTIQPCLQQNGLLSDFENSSVNVMVTENSQCGNTQGYSNKILCSERLKSAPQNLSDLPPDDAIVRCDLECSDSCRCVLAHRQVLYCPYTDKKQNTKTNGLLFFPDEFKTLNMSYSFLFEIKRGTFKGMKRLQHLNLSRNVLTSLTDGVFEGLSDLTSLNLSYNLIKSIDKDAFSGIGNIQVIDLDNNRLTTIPPTTFRGLTELVGLLLPSNYLQRLQPELFTDLRKLKFLSLYKNNLTTVESNTFSTLHNVGYISLSSNDITTLEPGAFYGLNLNMLALSTNSLEKIHEDAFEGVRAVRALDMQENGLRKLPSACIQDLHTVMFLNLSNNHLHVVPELGPLKNARMIDLRNNELSFVHRGTFNGLPNATTVLVNEPVSCCFVSTEQCIASTPPPKYITCGRLLPNALLEVSMWVLGWLAVLGNIFVLVWRHQGKFEENQVQVLLIINLACSDMLMGIYMLAISSADIHFGRYFPAQAEYWRTSRFCQAAGVLAVSSSEASVFFVTLISIDRYTRIAFPYAAHQLRYQSARVISFAIWMVAFAIGIVPTIMLRIDPELYDVSEVCIALPLVRKQVLGVEEIPYVDQYNRSLTRPVHVGTGTTKPNMYFSIAVFLGVNLLCFLIVLFCYIEIFWTVKRTGFTTNRRGRDKEIRMAMKMAVIVLTDFMCWMPIIILGILVQSGVATVPPTLFAWIATLILPINSSVNPFLYTMSTAITTMLRKKSLKDDTHPEMQPMNQSRAAFDMSTVLTRTRANTIEKDNSS